MRILALSILFLSLLSCKSKTGESDLSQVRTEVDRMLHAYHDAIRERGLTAEFDYLDRSPDFFWVPPGYHQALNYDSVHAILSVNASLFKLADFRWETLTVIPLSENFASFHGIVSGAMTNNSDSVSRSRMIESGTAILRKDGWKLLNGQTALIVSSQ